MASVLDFQASELAFSVELPGIEPGDIADDLRL